jgi:hypothetical protein
MYITSLLWVLFSIVFGVMFYRKVKHLNVIKIEVDQSDYESTASVTDYHIHHNTATTSTNNDGKIQGNTNATTV